MLEMFPCSDCPVHPSLHVGFFILILPVYKVGNKIHGDIMGTMDVYLMGVEVGKHLVLRIPHTMSLVAGSISIEMKHFSQRMEC